MQKDERDLLDVLKFELNYIEKGGYGRSPREPWVPQFIFEDSPTCMNYDCKEHPAPCSACVLTHWIPPEQRDQRIACRHIPLGPSGETLDYLYRWGDQHDIEESVENWLRAAIAHLEEERKALPPVEHNEHASDGQAVTDLPLCQNLHPKCANPACPDGVPLARRRQVLPFPNRSDFRQRLQSTQGIARRTPRRASLLALRALLPHFHTRAR